ncbi:MAG: hypothetical protein KIT11_08105 [Fimbriimonadaceae bacterium]|nr:hypothetical protein [Fimbriimonadaceae bacterium]QYK56317.1 MAG: hypothetical protein KF733_02300 [Fimbriimonadaceae bacterium]
MPVLSIECELTKAQLKRHLSGEKLPEVLLQDLEKHLKACPECLQYAKSLNAVKKTDPAPESDTVPPTPLQKIMRMATVTARPAKGLNPEPGKDPFGPQIMELLRRPKNMLLSVLLAMVAVTMSAAFRTPTALLGPKASEVRQDQEAVSEEATDEPLAKEEEPGHHEAAPKAEKHEAEDGEKQPGAPESKHPDSHSASTSEHSKKEHGETPASTPHEEHAAAEKATHEQPNSQPKTHGVGLKKPALSNAHEPSGTEKVIIADSTHAPVEKPKVVTAPRVAPRRPTTKTRTLRPGTKGATQRALQSSPSIRVYDEHGKPKS